ncbi:MAG TPA: hypothetical protein VF156_15545 [Agromyces sp.]
MARVELLEQIVVTDEHRGSGGTLEVAYEVGRWCYFNDAECPYRTDHEFVEWKRGYADAAAGR